MPLALIHFLFCWVVWNCFLALVPVAMARKLAAWLTQPPPSRWSVAALFAAWVAFVPNTAYLLTEWRHFVHHVTHTPTSTVMLLALSLFFVLYSGFGVLCLALSLRPLHRLLPRWRVPGPLVGALTFALISLGVYLGLVVRLNSWDLVTRPEMVLQAAASAVVQHGPALMALALLLWVLYEGMSLGLDAFDAHRRVCL